MYNVFECTILQSIKCIILFLQVAKSAEHVQTGVKHLQSAKKSQRKSRRWMCSGIVLGIIIIIAVIIASVGGVKGF